MSVTQQYRATIQQLKKRINELERQQQQARKKLQRAMKQARKVATTYQARLNATVQQLKKTPPIDMAACTKAAVEMERNLLRDAEKKAKALAAAVMEIDRKQISQLVQGFLEKFRSGAVVKSAKAKKAKPAARKKAVAKKAKKKAKR